MLDDALLDELGTDRAKLRRTPMPGWTPPMLATLSNEVFSDPRWVFEVKLDGQRSLVFRTRASLRLMTRNEKDRTSHYPDLVAALEAGEDADLIADGEIVAFDGDRTSFSRLQDRMQNPRPSARQIADVPVYLFLFDLLWYGGYDLTRLPLLARKRLLRTAFAFGERIRYSDHIETDGVEAFHAACERGLEGLVAKRVDAPYTPGRSRDWLKCKCVLEEEFVIVGWTDPHGAREGIGALLVGYHEGPDLRFAGKVGTGFSERVLRELRERLTPLEQPDPSVSPSKGLPRKGVHWVRPELVAQVGFSEWTGDGKLRHPRYLGLRDDKRPDEVVRERGTVPGTGEVQRRGSGEGP